eukprot:836653-Karenia_brevis.AAC.1
MFPRCSLSYYMSMINRCSMHPRPTTTGLPLMEFRLDYRTLVFCFASTTLVYNTSTPPWPQCTLPS